MKHIIFKNSLFGIIILSIYPIIFLYTNNIQEIFFSEIFIPFLISIVVSFLIYKLFSLRYKDSNKAGFLTILFIVLFYSFGHISKYIKELNNINESLKDNHWLLLVILVLVTTFIYKKLIKTKTRLNKTTQFINFASLILLILIIIDLLTHASLIKLFKPKKAIQSHQSKQDYSQSSDIYYIIPDRYANNKILKEFFNFDNQDFTDYLENKGFIINEDSFINYPKTHLSMASTFNMTYLDDLSKKQGKQSEDKKPAFDMVENNFVQNFLRQNGYRFIYLGGWWGPTQQNNNADYNYNLYGKGSDFIRQLSSTTLLVVIADSKLAQFIPAIAIGDQMKRENIKYQFSKLSEIANLDIDRPKLVIAHLFIPHYPYLFDDNCQPKEFVKDQDEDGQYLAQLKCANIFFQKTIDLILANSKKPPIIIIQSDEGPFKFDEMYRNGENNIDWTKVSVDAIRYHMMNFSAFYLPQTSKSASTHDTRNANVYQGMSSVNTFRVIFNRYFNTNYPLLPDKAYFIPYLDKSYDYFEVTNKIFK